MDKHECVSTIMCSCNINALEPDERCPVHMGAPPDRQCDKCGRFVPRSRLRSMSYD